MIGQLKSTKRLGGGFTLIFGHKVRKIRNIEKISRGSWSQPTNTPDDLKMNRIPEKSVPVSFGSTVSIPIVLKKLDF